MDRAFPTDHLRSTWRWRCPHCMLLETPWMYYWRSMRCHQACAWTCGGTFMRSGRLQEISLDTLAMHRTSYISMNVKLYVPGKTAVPPSLQTCHCICCLLQGEKHPRREEKLTQWAGLKQTNKQTKMLQNVGCALALPRPDSETLQKETVHSPEVPHWVRSRVRHLLIS